MNYTHLIIQSEDPYIPAAETIFNRNQPFWWDAARIIEDDFTFPLYEKAQAEHNRKRGKKNEMISKGKSGFYICAVPANRDYSDIAADATLRAAAVKQFIRRKHPDLPSGPAILVYPEDIMRKIRVQKSTSLILFLVDLSWSMAVTQRIAATKKAITTILSKAYEFRNDICLITFQKEGAEIIIPPTHSIFLAEKAMKKVSVGGKTPLAAGLVMAENIIKREIRNYGKENITLILLSDCDGNVALHPENPGNPQEDAIDAARQIAAEGCHAIIINSDQMSFGQGHANNLAKNLNASCYLISGFNEDHLLKAVRNELII